MITASSAEGGHADAKHITITAILCSFNRREKTLSCLRSFLAQRTAPAMRLNAVLVDDGSADGTASAVRDSLGAQVEVIQGDGSLFWAKAMSVAEAAALLAGPDFVIWLNDDVQLKPDALQMLLSVSTSSPALHVVAGPTQDSTGVTTYGGLVRSSRWHPMRYRLVRPSGSTRRVDTVHGNVLLVPSPTAARVGGIEGRFEHAYADFDYGHRVVKLGGDCLLAPDHVGFCEANLGPAVTATAAATTAPQVMRAMLGPKAMPLRSQALYLRRHGGLAWPVFVISPYAKYLLQHVWRRVRRHNA